MSAPKYRPKKKECWKNTFEIEKCFGMRIGRVHCIPHNLFAANSPVFRAILFNSVPFEWKNSVELHLNWCINAKRPVLIWITTASIFTCDSLFLFLSLRCAFYASILHNSIYCYLHIFALRLSAWDAAEMQNLYCLWKLKWIAITVLMCLVCFELCAVPTDIPLFHCILSLILFSIIILANE